MEVLALAVVTFIVLGIFHRTIDDLAPARGSQIFLAVTFVIVAFVPVVLHYSNANY